MQPLPNDPNQSSDFMRRYMVFLFLTMGMIMYFMYSQPAREEQIQQQAREQAEKEADRAVENKEVDAVEKGGGDDADAPRSDAGEEDSRADRAEAGQEERDEKDEEDGETTSAPDFDPSWVTLGSADGEGPYRMLVTLTNHGASVARIELSEDRYLDSQDRSGYLGNLVVDVPEGPGVPPGCPVQVVGAGTPAAQAGLKPGDRILGYDGEPVESFEDLRHLLLQSKPKETVELNVARGEKTLTLEATLVRRPVEIVRPETSLYNFADYEALDGIHEIDYAENHPLSFLMTLQQIDDLTLELPESVRENHKKVEGNLPPDETIRDELPGVDLRSGNWELVRSGPEEAVFRRPVPRWGLEAVKTYRLEKSEEEDASSAGYHLTLEVELRNTGDRQREIAYQLDGPTGLPVEGAWYARGRKVGPGWGSYGLRDVVVRFQGNNVNVVRCSDISRDEPEPWKIDRIEPLDFIGVDTTYFSCVLIPQKEEPTDHWFQEAVPLRVGASVEDWLIVTDTSCRMITTSHSLAAGESLSHRYRIFAGPKKPQILRQYGLDGILFYGWFWFVAKPMLLLLHFFNDYFVFNYGLAIILLTVLVRLSMYPISRKMVINAQKMSELQPELQKIAEKYKDNLEARSKAQQELFKKHDYHPLQGCAPMFLQIPIFIGLYRSLAVDVELRGSPLISESIRWCSNLAAPDMLFDWSNFWSSIGWPSFNTGQGFIELGPFMNLLPLVTVALFMIQQILFMPPPTNDQARMQRNIMQVMMLVMGLLFFKVASGLCVYFIASSLWGITERKLIHPVDPVHKKKAATEGGGPPQKDSSLESAPPKKAQKGKGSDTAEGSGEKSLWQRILEEADASSKKKISRAKKSEAKSPRKKRKKKR